MKDIFPNKIPVFPLSGVIYFPNTNLPLNIFEKRYVDLVNDCMKKNKLIDKIISEPLGGAHNDREKTFNNVKNAILNSFKTLSSKKIDELIIDRMNKFTSMGVYSS